LKIKFLKNTAYYHFVKKQEAKVNGGSIDQSGKDVRNKLEVE